MGNSSDVPTLSPMSLSASVSHSLITGLFWTLEGGHVVAHPLAENRIALGILLPRIGGGVPPDDLLVLRPGRPVRPRRGAIVQDAPVGRPGEAPVGIEAVPAGVVLPAPLHRRPHGACAVVRLGAVAAAEPVPAGDGPRIGGAGDGGTAREQLDPLHPP